MRASMAQYNTSGIEAALPRQPMDKQFKRAYSWACLVSFLTFPPVAFLLFHVYPKGRPYYGVWGGVGQGFIMNGLLYSFILYIVEFTHTTGLVVPAKQIGFAIMGFYSLCGIGCFLVMKKGLQDMSS
jgi:hypothetical protein